MISTCLSCSKGGGRRGGGGSTPCGSTILILQILFCNMQFLKINWLSERKAASKFFLSSFFITNIFCSVIINVSITTCYGCIYIYILYYFLSSRKAWKKYIISPDIYNYRYGSTLAQRTNTAQGQCFMLIPYIYVYRGPNHVKTTA